MAAKEVATGVLSCVSSVSKLKVALSETGCVGLKSQKAEFVVLGMVAPCEEVTCSRERAVANLLSGICCRDVDLAFGREFFAVWRPRVVANPAQARDALAELCCDGRRQPGVDVF